MPVRQPYGQGGAGAPPEMGPAGAVEVRAEARVPVSEGHQGQPRRRLPLVLDRATDGTSVARTSPRRVLDERSAGGPEAAVVPRRTTPSGRRRQREVVPRPHRVTPRLSDEELYLVRIAAAVQGLTVTGHVAKVAVEVAAGRVRPAPTGLAEALGELLAAREQVRRFSVLVNQAVAKWHAIDELPVELLRAVELVSGVLPRLEQAALDIRRRGTGPGGR